MKITISTFLALFTCICCAFSQVTSVNYALEYNEDTELFEARLIINAGSATTITERIQFNAQYSIVVPTGSVLTVVESFMPLQSNAAYTGTTPIAWEAAAPTVSPVSQPENDFYSITPDLGITSHYNNLVAGDTIPLFNLSVTGDDVCDLSVRIYKNGVDPSSTSAGMGMSDFTNGFTLGGINQLYSDNSYYQLNSSWDVTMDDYSICNGDCVTLSPNLNCAATPIDYLWNTGEFLSSITVCPDVTTTYQVTITGPANFTETVETTVMVENIDMPVVLGSGEICIHQSTQLSPFEGGIWESSDNNIATIDNNGVVTGIAEGSATFIFTDNNTLCSSPPSVPIIVLPLPEIQISGDDAVCVGESSTMFPSFLGTWMSTNPNVATVDDEGIITAIAEGSTTFILTDNNTGCTSEESDIFTVFAHPTGEINGADIICIGDMSELSSNAQGTWISSDPAIATVTNSGIVNGISEGSILFYFTSDLSGCTSEAVGPLVVFSPSASTSASTLEIGDYATLSSTTPGIWTNMNPELITLELPNKVLGLSEGIATLLFTDNQNNCETSLEIEVIPEVNNFQGIAFRDVNNNGILDSNEDSPLPNCSVFVPAINATYFSDENGYFNVELPSGTFDVEFLVSFGDWLLNPLVKEIIVDNSTEYLFAPFSPDGAVSSGSIIVGSSLLQCNSIVDLNISVFNNGNQPLQGYLVIDIDDRSFVDSSIPFPSGSEGNKLTWEVTELLPGFTFSPEIKIDIPNQESENDSLFFNGHLLSLNGDTLANFNYADIINCSENIVNLRSWPDRPGDENLTLRSENLDYTIRFQNTTSEAISSVMITDIVDDKIDPRSLKIKDSSHKVTSKILDNTLYFEFDDISLESSSSDFIASQGFVSFEFKFYDDIVEGSQIYNEAVVLLDGSTSYTTNKVVNTIVSDIKVSTTNSSFNGINIYPNPASNHIYIDTQEKISSVALYSKLGTLISTYYDIHTIDISNLSSGLYIIDIQLSNGRTHVEKVVVE